MPDFYDLSPTICEKLAVFPGDVPMSRQVAMDTHNDDIITLTSLTATVHLGSHVDAPRHYGKNVPTIEQMDLSLFMGPAVVIHYPAQPGQTMTPADLEPLLLEARDSSPIDGYFERVLVSTKTFLDPNQWKDTFAAFAPETIDWLADQGVKLVGIDTPSVDPATSKTLDAHHRCLEREVYILEGIILHPVPAGVYELIALPLKLEGFDASPVRAILRNLTAPEIL